MSERIPYRTVYIKAIVPGQTLDECREFINADPVAALDGAEYSFKRVKLEDGCDGLRNEIERLHVKIRESIAEANALDEVIDRQAARIAELEKQSANLGHIVTERNADVAQLQKQLNEAGQIVRACEAERRALAATFTRLEQDNRRLRHLDAMPVDAMERFHDEANMIDPVYVESGNFDDDHGAIREWLATLDGDA